MMSPPPPAGPPPLRRMLRWGRTLVMLVAITYGFTVLLRLSSRSLNARGRDAGFPDGVLHGICMPAALPHLLLGHDMPIFAERNNGRNYKLGYTIGVNGCGAVFFGSFYFRLQRLRRRLVAGRPPPET